MKMAVLPKRIKSIRLSIVALRLSLSLPFNAARKTGMDNPFVTNLHP
jgi:hypothetical protein